MVKAKVNLMVAKIEPLKYNGKTAKFLKKEKHNREILGKHWIEKDASMWAKRRLLQCVSHQFPCAKTFKIWGMWEGDNCRLCNGKRLNPEAAVDPKSVGHIQCYCPSLQRTRIVVYHGIWRELHMAISRMSKETNKDNTLKWYFPSAVSDSTL